jgi:hypothetical protein
MKKVFLSIGTLCILLFFTACNNGSEVNTHQHDDGAIHTDHSPDTANLQQQEFTVGDSVHADTVTKEVHMHTDGEKHSH